MAAKPEKALQMFFSAWQQGDWQEMVRHTQATWRNGQANPAAALETFFGFKKLLHSKIVHREVDSETVVKLTVNASYLRGRGAKSVKMTARMVCETAPHYADPHGQWGVDPASLLREESLTPSEQKA